MWCLRRDKSSFLWCSNWSNKCDQLHWVVYTMIWLGYKNIFTANNEWVKNLCIVVMFRSLSMNFWPLNFSMIGAFLSVHLERLLPMVENVKILKKFKEHCGILTNLPFHLDAFRQQRSRTWWNKTENNSSYTFIFIIMQVFLCFIKANCCKSKLFQ